MIECKELALEEAVVFMDLLLGFQYILPVVNFLSNDWNGKCSRADLPNNPPAHQID